MQTRQALFDAISPCIQYNTPYAVWGAVHPDPACRLFLICRSIYVHSTALRNVSRASSVFLLRLHCHYHRRPWV